MIEVKPGYWAAAEKIQVISAGTSSRGVSYVVVRFTNGDYVTDRLDHLNEEWAKNRVEVLVRLRDEAMAR
jgi:hypothetical protein